MASIHVTYLHLNAAAKSALLANRSKFEGNMDWYRIDAEALRSEVVQALSGCDAGTDPDVCRSDLLDLITDAITDSHDLDSTDRDAAESVLRALLDNIAPLPVRQEVAA